MKRFFLLAAFLLSFSLAQRESTLVLGGDFSDFKTADPQVSYEFSGSLITDNLYDTLVRFEGTNLADVKPALAESWTVETAADGTHKIIFTLRDAKFSSGNAVTAADVVYSVERGIKLGEAGLSPSAFLFTDVAKLQIGSTVAVDDKTVEMNLPANANPGIVLNLLTFNIGGIVDSATVAANEVDGDSGTAWLTDNSAGSGAYTLERWDRDAQVILAANPNNTTRVGPIKRVILRTMKESSVQQAALTSGEIDAAFDLTPEAFAAAGADTATFNAYKTDNFVIQYIGMNSGEGAPFADNRIRQAVRYAIDQDAIINDLLGGLGVKTQTIVPSGLLGFDSTIYFEHDPEKAKALLAEAGAEGMTFEFMVPDGSCGGGIPCPDLAAKIQSDLDAVGLKAEIRITPQSELLDLYRAQKGEMVLISWSPDYPDPDGNATPLGDFNAKSLAWRNAWQNEAASKLALDASLESDLTKRTDLYKQLTALVANEGPYAILFQPVKPIATRAYVQGFVRNAQGNVDFDKISKTE